MNSRNNTKKKYGYLIVLILLACTQPTPSHAVDVGPSTVSSLFGENLVPNGSFEEDDKTGLVRNWTARLQGKNDTAKPVSDIRLVGQKSLCLASIDSPAGIQVTSDPIPVEAGKTYLFSAAFRQAGFNTLSGYQSQYEGVSSYPSFAWLDQNRKQVSASNSGFPYGPVPWRLYDTFLVAPPTATHLIVGFTIGNNSLKHSGKLIPSKLWLDAVQLREYHPPATPEWAKGETARIVDGARDTSPIRAYFAASSPEFNNNRGGQWSKIVVDPAAERGSALLAPAGVGRGIMAHSPYFGAMPAGLYRLRARVKITDPNAKARAGFFDVDTSLAGVRSLLELLPSQFAKADDYQVLERDFILRDNGWWDIRIYTEGNQAWSVDSVKVVPLQEFQDVELMSIYPGIGGEISPTLEPRTADKSCRILFLAGLEYDVFQPQALRLLAQTVEIKTAWLKCGMFMTIAGFPETPETLFDFSAILLCNIPAKVLSLSQKNFLLEYVHRGGALVVLGGDQGFERGGIQGSLLEAALPLKAAVNVLDGMKFVPEGLRLSSVDLTPLWLKECDFTDPPNAYFMHQVTLKPEAKVFVKSGDFPFLTGGNCGKGRVVCVLAWPFGDPPAGQTAFWAWSDWPYLLRNAVWWTMRRPGFE